MFSYLDAASLVGNVQDGVSPGSDTSPLIVGVVSGLDVAAKQVQVTIGGSDPLWVPAMPGIYLAGGAVRLQRSPLDGGRAFLCMGPLLEGPSVVNGVVTAVNSGTLTVTVLGGSFTLPCASSTYSTSQLVHVVRNPAAFGEPWFVLGPQGSAVNPGGSTPGGGSGNPGQTVNRQATIGPQWSGSYRASYGWDRWNTDRYGGRSTLWQGNAFGSGAMTGLATYGDQIVNLGALSITSMVATVTRADSSVTTGKAPTLQASSNWVRPAGAPTLAGVTATGGALAPGQTGSVLLPSSVYESFRVGTYKGVATVGSDYAGFAGTARGDGMLLTIQYTALA